MSIQPSERPLTDRRRPGQFDRRAQLRDKAADRRAAAGAARAYGDSVLHDAAALGFSKRRPGARITWATVTYAAPLFERSVGEAANVSLHHMFETVLVRNIRSGPAGKWIGTIQSFERSRGPYRGMQVGDDVLFGEEHAFSAGLPPASAL